MKYLIQSIVFPTDEKHELCRDLFYREGRGVVDRRQKILRMPPNSLFDFCTYFNAISAEKWKKYTATQTITTHLKLKGQGSVRFVGYSFPLRQVERNEYGEIPFDFPEEGILEYTFPETEDLMLGFEILTGSSCEFAGGDYCTDVDNDSVRECTLSIATTTCRKEEYIKKNIRMIKDEILSRDEVRDHIYVHVVDNGQTLTEEDICGEHVYLHPNHNTGGAGGYARGMMESMHQTPKATHVLLMDDDIQVLPESILRTYRMLRIMKPEYRRHFIGGAMLYYEQPYRQHEDIGFVRHDGIFESAKRKLDHRKIKNNLENEADYIRQNNEYSAWWYCTIPAEIIDEYGYPLPIFIRGDDIEYSLRCHSERITMNGICVWHMGFATKFNYATDLYQQNRNLLIDKACSDIMQTVDPLLFFKNTFQTMLLRFDYNAAEVVLRAMRDYLKGPEFIMQDQGEAILKDNAKMNIQLKPLDEVAYGKTYRLDLSHSDAPRKAIDTFLRRLTYNGQRLWPRRLLRHSMPVVPLDRYHPAQKITLQENLILVNQFSQEGTILTLNKAKYKELRKEYHALIRQYKKEHVLLEQEYRKLFPVMTSEAFWKEYLGMNTQ